MTPDELEELVLAGAAWPLQRALAGLSEKERAKLSVSAQRLWRQLEKRKANDGASGRLRRYIQHPSQTWPPWNAKPNQLATLALFGLGPLSALTKSEVHLPFEETAVLDRIIRDRRPEWLDEWIARDLESDWAQINFHILRGWIRDDICRKPTVAGYYRMMAWSLLSPRGPDRDTVPQSVSAQLLADPEMLQDIKGLFRVENMGFDKNQWIKGRFPGHETWTDALVKLSSQGRLDRGELLDLAVQSLSNNLKNGQLAGFEGLHKRLAPTNDELAQRQPDYLALLGHPVGHVAKFAIDALSSLEKHGALDDEPVLREIPSVFANESKGNAVAALKLINRIVQRQRRSDPAAFLAVCEALRHRNTDAQTLALDILEANADRLGEEHLDAVHRLEDFVNASNRNRLSALTGRSLAVPKAEHEAAIAPRAGPYQAISSDINLQNVLSADDVIVPINSLDELIGAALHAAEVVNSPDEVERIIDAISRFASDRPADFSARVKPLLHRLTSGRGPTNSLLTGANVGVGSALMDLLKTWLTGRLHRSVASPFKYFGLEEAFHPMTEHLRSIAARVVRRQPSLLLSAPTHCGGWIDPLVWVERLQAMEQVKGLERTMDFRLSLLRLAPDNRRNALAQAATLPSPLRRIAIFALGGDARPTRADRGCGAAWISAARCRSPLQNWSAEFAPLNLDCPWPDGLRPAKYNWLIAHRSSRLRGRQREGPELVVVVDCDGAAERAPHRLAGWLTGRISTDWTALPTAALNRRLVAQRYWSEELTTAWMAQWLAFIWPQNPGAFYVKGAARLVTRINEPASNWSPTHCYLDALFQRNRPWGEPGHLLVCLGLVGKDADAKGLAIDAMVEGIDERLFDPDLFAATMSRVFEGGWAKLNRLAEGLAQVIEASELHAQAVDAALQKLVPNLDLRQNNAARLLEVLVEAQAASGQPIAAATQEALRGVTGSGQAAKIAKKLLAA